MSDAKRRRRVAAAAKAANPKRPRGTPLTDQDAFVGPNGLIIPQHLFEPYAGDKSREAPANLRPIGTGPYRFKDFKPGDMIVGEINPAYHQSNRPLFRCHRAQGGW